jgi:hypothetical protein
LSFQGYHEAYILYAYALEQYGDLSLAYTWYKKASVYDPSAYYHMYKVSQEQGNIDQSCRDIAQGADKKDHRCMYIHMINMLNYAYYNLHCNPSYLQAVRCDASNICDYLIAHDYTPAYYIKSCLEREYSRFSSAHIYMLKSAFSGNDHAQYIVAHQYKYGDGCHKNNMRYAYWMDMFNKQVSH